MPSIVRIEGVDNRGSYAIVHVVVGDELGNEEEATVYVGGTVEIFEHNGQIKAFVKRRRLDIASNKEDTVSND